MSGLAAAVRVLVERRYGVLVAAFLGVALFAGGFAEFRIGHSYEDWIDHDSPLFARYRAMVERFGDADTLIVAFDRSALTAENAPAYAALMERLRGMDGVLGVFDPAELMLGADAETPPDPVAIAALKDAFAAHRGDYRNVLVSPDVETLGVLILLDQQRRAAHAGILAAASAGFAELGIPVAMAGTAYFSEVLKTAIAADMMRVLVLLMLSAGLVLMYFFREPILVLCVFAGIVLSVLYTLALSSALALSINLLTLLVLPLVFCVGVTTAVHLFSRRRDGCWIYAEAVARMGRPSTLAALTTAIGCGAFLFAPQSIIARMGLVLPAAVAFSFITAVVFVPALLRLLAGPRRLPDMGTRHASPAPRVRRLVSAALIATAAVSVHALPALRSNPDALDFFPDDAALVRNYRFIESRLAGLLVTDLVIRSVDGGPVSGGEHAERIRAFIERLGRMPELSTVVSGYSMRTLAPPPLPPELGSAFFTADGRMTRVALRFRNLAERPFARLAEEVRATWNAAAMPGLEMEITGVIPLILQAQDQLLHLQSRMLLIVLGVISTVLLIAFRSFKLLALAVVANFIPLLITAGTMSWLSIPINSINLFVGSVMLGIVVDDTVHLLHALKVTGSIEAALREVGPALWITSVTVALAFATLLFSQLVPIRQFGLLSAVAVMSAWFCDVYLLPTMLGMKARAT